MNQFELRGVCVNLIERLKTSMGQSNLLKLSIDIKLPGLYNDDPFRLTKPLEAFSLFLSQLIINGIINIDIQKWQEQGGQMTLSIHISASNAPAMNDEKIKEIKERLAVISSSFNHSISDFNFVSFQNNLTCSFKVNLAITHQINEIQKALPFENKRILVAEDNEINAMVFSSFLEEWGSHNSFVSNGSQAVAFAKENPVDLILMDIYMPVLDGLKATGMIREFNANVPIIALTASTLETDINKAWAVGVNDLLFKPVSSDDLFRVLRKFL